MNDKRKILFAGFEFQQKLQRGIYLYTKALIKAARSAGHSTGILTESRSMDNEIPLLTNIYQCINEPQRLGKKRMLLAYLKYRALGARHVMAVEQRSNMITEENLWFLKDVDRFLNVPWIYEVANVAQRLKKPPLDLSYAATHGFDTLFTTSPLPVRSRNRKLKIVQTVHDLIPMNAAVHGERPDIFFERVKSCAENADLLLAVSEHTRQEFLQFFPQAENKIHVVYQTLPADEKSILLSEQQIEQEAVLEKFGLKAGQYSFYIGAIEARKNIHRLIAAHNIATRGRDHPLVIAGAPDMKYLNAHRLGGLFAKAQATGGVDEEKIAKGMPARKSATTRYVGYVSEVEKLCLLRNAAMFVFPTLTEGFGIPVLEAQSMGCPVVTTNVGSIPEVVGASASMVQDPFSVDEIASVIASLLNDAEKRDALRITGLANAKRFSNEAFADGVHRLLQKL